MPLCATCCTTTSFSITCCSVISQCSAAKSSCLRAASTITQELDDVVSLHVALRRRIGVGMAARRTRVCVRPLATEEHTAVTSVGADGQLQLSTNASPVSGAETLKPSDVFSVATASEEVNGQASIVVDSDAASMLEAEAKLPMGEAAEVARKLGARKEGDASPCGCSASTDVALETLTGWSCCLGASGCCCGCCCGCSGCCCVWCSTELAPESKPSANMSESFLSFLSFFW
mmetsp:Transcript_72531/g.201147  ORF Transcript_72531/g.201147 Transcript_72531/m.201147 type:complete len:232 (-) Transcript_72531:2065-2760(-)